MSTAVTPDWIAVDWGTTNLRAWAMGSQGPIAQASSHDGMGHLAKEDFEPALLGLIAPWLADAPKTVVACGMVGSRQGWHEAPYRSVPCSPLETGNLIAVPTKDPRLNMRIAPGLKQIQPADVMRGEETQIAGALAQMPGFEGVICLPGTHSKWAQVLGGQVLRFQTFLTGELFALLGKNSVLRHSVSAQGWDDAAFDRAVAEVVAHPEMMTAQLFNLRAEGLISGLSPVAARARLSGLLIGAELAASTGVWRGKKVVLIGAQSLSTTYARALAFQGVATELLDATSCTLAGLTFALGSAKSPGV